MKNTIIAFQLGLILLVFACNANDDWSDSSKISYQEAQKLESISFEYEGEVYESDSINSEALLSTFLCPEECDDDRSLYNKGYSIKFNLPDFDIATYFRLNFCQLTQKELVNVPITYISVPTPAFHEFLAPKNIRNLFLTEGTWTDEDRYIHTSFSQWRRDSTGFNLRKFLNDDDEFEVTEIQKIRWKNNTFLVSGFFNIVISDDRSWIPVNDREEPKILTNGTFSVIVEPTDL